MNNLTIDHNYSTIKAINKLNKLRGRSLVVVKNKNIFKGILSYYDIRRSIIDGSITKKTINDIYNKRAQFIYKDVLKNKFNKISEKVKELSIIPIVDRKSKKLVEILDFKKISRINKKHEKKINCDIVIMAGGKGTRLKPYTEVLPKPLLPIKNKPIIRHIIEKLEKFSPKKFLITLNYKSKLLSTYLKELKNETDTRIEIVIEKKPLGTIGGISLLKKRLSKNFILTNCDTILNSNYYDLYNFHIKNNNDITVVTAKKKFIIPYGHCEKNNNKFKFTEKPKIKLNVNTGFYIIKKSCLKYLREKYTDFNEFLEICIKKGQKIDNISINSNTWIDVGQKDKYQNYFNKHI